MMSIEVTVVLINVCTRPTDDTRPGLHINIFAHQPKLRPKVDYNWAKIEAWLS